MCASSSCIGHAARGFGETRAGVPGKFAIREFGASHVFRSAHDVHAGRENAHSPVDAIHREQSFACLRPCPIGSQIPASCLSFVPLIDRSGQGG
jgi:hypothetical protein